MNGFSSGRLFEPVSKSQNDMAYAESIRQFGGLKNTWIGIIQDSWHYTKSGEKVEFENWHPGARDCVHLFNGLWYNYDCNYKAFFICQFVQGPSYDYNYYP